jgi:hypothetical protein
MTLVQDGADLLIGQFGVTVEVYEQTEQDAEDSNNPVFFEHTDNDSNFTEHTVRLYTSVTDEMMQEYGLDHDAEAIMYDTSDIASEGDKVKYPDGSYTWIITERRTNQLDDTGPYIYVYSMRET